MHQLAPLSTPLYNCVFSSRRSTDRHPRSSLPQPKGRPCWWRAAPRGRQLAAGDGNWQLAVQLLMYVVAIASEFK